MALTAKWTELEKHDQQMAYWKSTKRFIVCSSGRRSGKTEIAKRKLVRAAMTFHAFPNGRFICSAPTHPQAKEIFWEDLQALVPKWARSKPDTITPIPTIHLFNGAKIQVIGLDKASRIEGSPVDGIVLDEYGNMKESAWTQNIRPALATKGRPGWALIIGVPEGRNHYWKTKKYADDPANEDWESFHWFSSDILDPAEIAEAKRSMDKLSYEQEFEGSFLNFSGRAYYSFEAGTNESPLMYDSTRPLIFCFDFNTAPGVCGIVQEQFKNEKEKELGITTTYVIDEVYIDRDSNTQKVCRALIKDWRNHKGSVWCYGDATGGAKKSQSVAGSDWDIIEDTLRPAFGDQLSLRYNRGNPREKVRVNAMNTRLRAASGTVRMLIDPIRAKHVVDDLEGVSFKEDGSGELEKKKAPTLTHISDAIGYYIAEKFPMGKGVMTSSQI